MHKPQSYEARSATTLPTYFQNPDSYKPQFAKDGEFPRSTIYLNSPGKTANPAEFSNGTSKIASEKTLIRPDPPLLDPTNLASKKRSILQEKPIEMGEKIDHDIGQLAQNHQGDQETDQSKIYEDHSGKVPSAKPAVRNLQTAGCPSPVVSLPRSISLDHPAQTLSNQEQSMDGFPLSKNPLIQPRSSLSRNMNVIPIDSSTQGGRPVDEIQPEMIEDEYPSHDDENLPKYTSDDEEIAQNYSRISLKQDESYIGRLRNSYRAPPTVSTPKRVIKDDKMLKNAPS